MEFRVRNDPVFAERAKRHHPTIAGIERQLAFLKPSRLRDHLAQQQATLIARLHDQNNPCFPRPPGILRGPISIAIDDRDNQPIGLTTNNLCTHLITTGTTGSGKTSVSAYVTKNLAQHDLTVKTSYFDPKGDFRKRALDDPRCTIITPTIPLNILRPPSFLHPEAYHALLFETFGRAHWAGYQQTRALQEAKTAAYQKTADPSLADLVSELRPMMTKDHTYTHRDAAENLQHKLRTFERVTPGIFHAKGNCITIEDLTNQPVYWPAPPGD